YKGKIRYWEVWNEGNGGFNDDHDTTADYARLAAEAGAAARKADVNARVGLTVASFDAPYLREAVRAQVAAGQTDVFDFLCIHPYEIADGLAEVDGEIPFLWMRHRLRQAIRSVAPKKADVPIWITEVGRRLDARAGRVVTETDAANGLVKIYTLAIAQGIAHTQWFEAQDPVGEEPGFGLIDRNGQTRPAYAALKTLTTKLGPTPEVLGWLQLGAKGRGYGFVFHKGSEPVLVAWMPPGEKATMTLKEPVFVGDLPGRSRLLADGMPLDLGDVPIFVNPLPQDLLKLAKANAAKPYPWGGNYASASGVSLDFAAPESQGVFTLARRTIHKFADGSQGWKLGANEGSNFFVHPSFATMDTRDYYIRLTVRRIGPGNVGMNCVYEVADSQGRTPYKNVGDWFGLQTDEGWQTHTWHVTDACFSAMWGYDFCFRPEQSVPFVIGKIEVSTQPFK
ncbi:MAG TPA: hypothetical protein VE981_23105, partial [Planctomycetota bacterium]|nr:hypothetical protein [Planctomycetota bacterium]